MKSDTSLLQDPAFYQTLLERLMGQSATLVVDEHGIIIYASKAAEQFLHMTEQQLVNQDFFSAIHLKDRKGHDLPQHTYPVWQALHDKQHRQVTPFFCSMDRGEGRVPVATRALQFKTGRTIRGAIVEIREVRRALDVGEMKSLFVSFAAHQLKTPSSIVKGFLELMLREGESAYAPHQWYNLESAFEANENLIALSKNLLNLTRLEGGLIEPKPVLFNPHAIIREKINARHLLLDVKEVRVELEVNQTTESFLSDQVFFSEIYEILFSNALKFAPPRSVIHVACDISPNELRVEVRDEGPGVTAEAAAKLFHAATATDPAHNNHGVGLLMAKKYVSLLRGSIGLRTDVKKGAAFYFVIPKPVV